MDALALLLLPFGVYVFICMLVGAAASNKGRNGWGFFFLSFFLSPILGGIIVLCMATPPVIESTGTRKCPYCAETIKEEAIVCRFCSAKIEPINAKKEPENQEWEWNESFLKDK